MLHSNRQLIHASLSPSAPSLWDQFCCWSAIKKVFQFQISIAQSNPTSLKYHLAYNYKSPSSATWISRWHILAMPQSTFLVWFVCSPEPQLPSWMESWIPFSCLRSGIFTDFLCYLLEYKPQILDFIQRMLFRFSLLTLFWIPVHIIIHWWWHF